MRGRPVFDRWLTISTHVTRTFRVAVWRVVRSRQRDPGLWSDAERAAMAREMRRAG